MAKSILDGTDQEQ
jgi:hypothetical protein